MSPSLSRRCCIKNSLGAVSFQAGLQGGEGQKSVAKPAPGCLLLPSGTVPLCCSVWLTGRVLQPPPAFLERYANRCRIRRLRRPPRLNRRQCGDCPLHVVAEQWTRVLPFLEGERTEVPPFGEQAPDQSSHDFVRLPERHTARNEIVGDVGGQQQSRRRVAGPIAVQRQT